MSDEQNYLLLIDTTQTQKYIFKSNRMRENIGASYLLAEATTTWVLWAINKTQKKHNLLAKGENFWEIDESNCFEADLDAEVIYVGGGNALIVFRSKKGKEEFVGTYTRRLLEYAPNLTVQIVDKQFSWDETNQHCVLQETVEALFKKKEQEKSNTLVGNLSLGLGVSVPCRGTTVPAIGFSPMVQEDQTSMYPVSAEIMAKLKSATPSKNSASLADQQLNALVPLNQELYRYPLEFEDIVPHKHDANYIAIAHVDGDGIGEYIENLGKNKSWSNRQYIQERRNFSKNLSRAIKDALKKTLKKLEDEVEGNIESWELNGCRYEQNKDYLPFRPIISAGDDLTFVCDGRVGISLAIIYMKAFEKACREYLQHPFTASAGIAIVRTHYPFARAYALAEELTKNAKQFRKGKDEQNEQKYSQLESGCIDWHFTTGVILGSISEIRQREYRSQGSQNLLLRPLTLRSNQSGLNHRTWEVIEKAIIKFTEKNEEEKSWADMRNKVKALREALRKDKDGVKQFLNIYGLESLPDIIGKDHPSRNEGYYKGRSLYFDALELADWFIPLKDEA